MKNKTEETTMQRYSECKFYWCNLCNNLNIFAQSHETILTLIATPYYSDSAVADTSRSIGGGEIWLPTSHDHLL